MVAGEENEESPVESYKDEIHASIHSHHVDVQRTVTPIDNVLEGIAGTGKLNGQDGLTNLAAAAGLVLALEVETGGLTLDDRSPHGQPHQHSPQTKFQTMVHATQKPPT